MKNKLYLSIPFSIIILLFSIAAICGLGGQDSEEDDEAARKAAEQAIEEEALRKETEQRIEEVNKDSESSTNEDDQISGEDNSKDSNNKDNNPTENNEIPTINLEIYEGPTYSKSDDVCYYRIEAKITGTPDPSIKFSRDDSSGAWGNKKVQINLKRGESYTLSATVTNTEGKATDSIKLDWDCGDSNRNPVIAGIGLSSNDLYTLTEYEISAAATDPDGDSLTYKWSIDGGVLSNSTINPTKWETPGFPETYHITVEVSDGKGGKATETRAVRVEEIVVIGDNPPQVHDIIIYSSPIFTDTKYFVHGDVSDPDNDLHSFYFDVSGGTLSGQSANDIYWTTPVNEGDYSISLIARDREGNEDLLVVFFQVETEWIVVD